MICPDMLQKEFGEPLSNLQLNALLKARMEIRIIGRGKGVYKHQPRYLISNRRTHLFLYRNGRILPEKAFTDRITNTNGLYEINVPENAVLFDMNRCHAKDSFGGSISIKEIHLWLETMLDVPIKLNEFKDFFAKNFKYRYKKIKKIEAHIRAMRQIYRDEIRIGTGIIDKNKHSGSIDFGYTEIPLKIPESRFDRWHPEGIDFYRSPEGLEILEITPMVVTKAGYTIYEIRVAIPDKELRRLRGG